MSNINVTEESVAVSLSDGAGATETGADAVPAALRRIPRMVALTRSSSVGIGMLPS